MINLTVGFIGLWNLSAGEMGKSLDQMSPRMLESELSELIFCGSVENQNTDRNVDNSSLVHDIADENEGLWGTQVKVLQVTF